MCWFLGVEVFNQPEQTSPTSHGVKEKKTTWNKSEKKKLSHITKKEKQRWAKRDKLSSLSLPPPPRIQRQSPNQTKGKGKGKGYFVKGTALQNCWANLFALECKHPKKEGGEGEKISILFHAKKTWQVETILDNPVLLDFVLFSTLMFDKGNEKKIEY